MSLSYLEAKAKICPDGPVSPGSKEHMDILELMRKSGRLFAEENVVEQKVLIPAKTMADIMPFASRPEPPITRVTMAMSKKRWLQSESNRTAFDEHLKTYQPVPAGAFEPIPQHMEWNTKIVPIMDGPISKHKWISLLK